MRTLLLGLCLLVLPAAAAAESQHHQEKKEHDQGRAQMAHRTPMVEDKDGDLQPNEFEVVSKDGSITRSFCPYSCNMKGIPNQHCQTWKSQIDPNKCYVKDKRGSSNAVPMQ